MPTPAQIAANQQNAQLSTGPVTEEGKLASSQNAVKHGFSGLSLVITESERIPYEAHVKAYFDEHNPTTHKQTLLVQQLADLDWSLTQINVQQLNIISLMNACQSQFAGNGDPVGTAQVIAKLARTLNTFNLYEQRRRRASKAVAEELQALVKAASEAEAQELAMAAAVYQLHQSKGKPFHPADFGFVCSIDEIEQYLTGQTLAQREPSVVGLDFAVDQNLEEAIGAE
jgi:hypothetical protein